MPKVTIAELQQRKREGGKLTMLTAYDYPIAKLVDEAGVDIVLVGDSLGMVVQGQDTTIPVTLDEVGYHTRAVARGARYAHVVGDMPFMSFQLSARDALKSAGKLVKEGMAESVKLEGGVEVAEHVRRITRAGIPVMGHVGLTPQSLHSLGGFRVQGKDAESAARIIAQAVALQEVGCFAMVLECVPDLVAQEITQRLRIPTIGIGSGPFCDGQVLVTYDLIGLFERFKPKFVKRYAETASTIRQAAAAYVQDVQSGAFPGKEQTTVMDPQEFAKLKQELGS